MQGCIILATRKPEQVPWVRQQYQQQLAPLPLIVVANGRANPYDYPFAKTILTGPEHKSECLRRGEQHAIAMGCDWISYWDDDDYYGPKYLLTVASAMQKKPVAGQRCRYLRTREGRLWRTLGERGTILGGCLAARVGVASWADIPNDIGPEQRWQKRVPLSNILTLPPGHFAQCRWPEGSHTWDRSDRHIAFASGGAVDLGAWSEDVVNLRQAEPEATSLGLTPRDLFA